MRAQLASAEAFRQAGLDLPTTLLGIKFAIDKRPNGQSVIKLTSDKPINDPFVDMLLEINWPAGRLVREYTFLLDPPELAAKASAPVAPAISRPADSRPAPASEPAPARATLPDKRSDAASEHEVKRGETLHRIASEAKPEGVSLEQMLVGLFRANPDAFDGSNMNRLKAGKILTIPEKGTIEALGEVEARKVVLAHSSDWNAYRRKLAAVAAQAPASDDAGRQQAAGRITAKVEDKAAAVEAPKDQVKVSTSDAGGAKAGAVAKRGDEDLVAKEKALKEANERLTSLEKNVAELQRLLEMKNQSLAELQMQAAGKAAPSPESQKPEAPTAASAAASAPAPDSIKPSESTATSPAVDKPVAPAAAPEPKPAAEMPKPKPKPAPPPPEPEPSFVDELLANPALLAGGGGILALLAGYFVYRRRRAAQGEMPQAAPSALSQPGSSLTTNSVFRNTGGQSVDTSHTPAQTDFSQAGPGSIDTDEVDPVAEADVYMAYGRDVQAEEILLEARQKDPKRLAIHLKLLEIYANRKSVKQFEALATDLYSETGGVGADWEKAAAMGLRLDPQNPLYGSSAQSAAPQAEAFDPDATVVVSSRNLRNAEGPSGQLAPFATVAAAGVAAAEMQSAEAPDIPLEIPAATEEPAPAADPMSLDFDLGTESGFFAGEPEEKVPEDTQILSETVVDPEALDFDLGLPEAAPAPAEAAEPLTEEVGALDFNLPEISLDAEPQAEMPSESEELDFDLGIEPAPEEPAELEAETMIEPVQEFSSEPLEAAGVADHALEFDVRLTDSTILGQPMQEASFDMSSISLDLAEAAPAELSAAAEATVDETQAETVVNPDFASEQVDTLVNPEFSTEQAETVVNPQFGMTPEAAPDLEITASEEVATKLDLARAYEEMGDLEGARELLQEVLNEGDAAQREKAQAILAKIGE